MSDITTSSPNTNKFCLLISPDMETEGLTMNEEPTNSQKENHPQQFSETKNKTDHTWTNDTEITTLTESNFKLLQNGNELMADSGEDITNLPNYDEPTQHINEPYIVNQRIYFNLVRHRGAASNIHTLKLLKSFTTTLCNIDPTLAILPTYPQSNTTHCSPTSNR
jgi:hypothetical protein